MLGDDTAVFINSAEFSQPAVFNSATVVQVIFSDGYIEAFDDLASTSPTAIVAAADVSDPINKTLEIGSVEYVIRNKQPSVDGLFLTLILERQGSL